MSKEKEKKKTISSWYFVLVFSHYFKPNFYFYKWNM